MTPTIRTGLSRAALALAAAIGVLGAGQALAADVVVEVTGLRAGTGHLYVALQTEGEFMRSGTLGTRVENASAGAHRVVISNVPAGDYAVAVWHDTNGNAVFDRGPNGLPLDGWAFSGDVLSGPPSFAASKITVGAKGASVSLRVVYPD